MSYLIWKCSILPRVNTFHIRYDMYDWWKSLVNRLEEFGFERSRNWFGCGITNSRMLIFNWPSSITHLVLKLVSLFQDFKFVGKQDAKKWTYFDVWGLILSYTNITLLFTEWRTADHPRKSFLILETRNFPEANYWDNKMLEIYNMVKNNQSFGQENERIKYRYEKIFCCDLDVNSVIFKKWYHNGRISVNTENKV